MRARGKVPKFLFIDPQQAFVGNGWWASHWPPSETVPIAAACNAIDKLLREIIFRPSNPVEQDPDSPSKTSSLKLTFVEPMEVEMDSIPPPGVLFVPQLQQHSIAAVPSPPLACRVPFLCTRCYTDGTDALWAVPSLSNQFTPWLFKPNTDCSVSPGLDLFLEDCSTLYVGGCTTTSCVRVSSQQIRRRFPNVERIVVVLSLCGARRENYLKNAEQHSVLLRTYGYENCLGKSAIDLAVAQMRSCGVEVVDQVSDWCEELQNNSEPTELPER